MKEGRHKKRKPVFFIIVIVGDIFFEKVLLQYRFAKEILVRFHVLGWGVQGDHLKRQPEGDPSPEPWRGQMRSLTSARRHEREKDARGTWGVG